MPRIRYGRHSIGTGVVGGMLAATCIAIFFIPTFFKLIMAAADRLTGGPSEPTAATADGGRAEARS